MSALRVASSYIKRFQLEESFYIANIATLRENIATWFDRLPTVRPHYAVKCNPDPVVLKTMVDDPRIGFDCASAKEIHNVIGLGVEATRILFAHPCKKRIDMQIAHSSGVATTVFDNKYELEKIKRFYPSSNALMRISIDNPHARVQLGLKYGADPKEWRALLTRAIDKGIRLKGVSFHVGSACTDANVFKRAIESAMKIVDDMRTYSTHAVDTIDIGGGFQKRHFLEMSDMIASVLSDMDVNDKGVHIIAEPGRYFVEDVFTFFTPIIGMRKRKKQEYFIADGLYGSLNCVIYDKHTPEYRVLYSPLLSPPTGSSKYTSSVIWGSTCDSADIVSKEAMLPDNLRVGDFIAFKNFGAYTLAGACDFNGMNFTNPPIFYEDGDLRT